jgi:hypothetical protein
MAPDDRCQISRVGREPTGVRSLITSIPSRSLARSPPLRDKVPRSLINRSGLFCQALHSAPSRPCSHDSPRGDSVLLPLFTTGDHLTYAALKSHDGVLPLHSFLCSPVRTRATVPAKKAPSKVDSVPATRRQRVPVVQSPFESNQFLLCHHLSGCHDTARRQSSSPTLRNFPASGKWSRTSQSPSTWTCMIDGRDWSNGWQTPASHRLVICTSSYKR